MKQTRIIDGSPIAFKALLLTLTLFAAGVLLFCNSLTPLDRTWLLSAILVSAAAFFVLSFEKKVEYVKRVDIISIPDNKEEAQAKEPVRETTEKKAEIVPIEVKVNAERGEGKAIEPPVVEAKGSEPAETKAGNQPAEAGKEAVPIPVKPAPNPLRQDLRVIRTHYIEPLVKLLADMDTSSISDEQRKEIRTDLYQIAFLLMDYTNLVTRPNPLYEKEIMGLATGEKSIQEVIERAIPVSDNPKETPKWLRNLKAILASDGDSFFFFGHRL